MRRFAGTAWRYFWPAPYTLLALMFATAIRLSDGTWRCRAGVLEVYGPAAKRLLAYHPIGGVVAIALGHVIIARDLVTLELTSTHERTHVRQFEAWGWLFPLVYGAASLLAWARGGHYYTDNRFERAAEAASELHHRNAPIGGNR